MSKTQENEFPECNNERGLKTYTRFRDSYGYEVRVQDSSAASEPHCWIFMEPSDPTVLVYGKGHIPAKEVFLDREFSAPSPHLNREQAKKLIEGLQLWLKETKEGVTTMSKDSVKVNVIESKSNGILSHYNSMLPEKDRIVLESGEFVKSIQEDAIPNDFQSFQDAMDGIGYGDTRNELPRKGVLLTVETNFDKYIRTILRKTKS